MTDPNELERWWSALSPDQRAKARGRTVDKLDPDLRTSLEGAGLLNLADAKDTDTVNAFLKTRH